MATGESLTSRTLRGMAWSYGSYVGGRVLVLVATAILARLLTPSDFGLVALALTFISFLDIVSDLGMPETLVVVRESDVEEQAETAFALMVGTGTVLAALSIPLGPVAASFYHHHALVGIVPTLGATMLLKSLGSAHYALAQKRMDFRARTGAELAEVVVRGSTGIALALLGAGAWSLVAGYVAGEVTMVLVLWRVVPWRPRLRPRRAHLRPLLGFGGALTGIQVVAALNLNVDKLIVGRVLGSRDLGLYTLSSRLPELVIINLIIVAGRVLFPAFAKVDREALGRAVVTALRGTFMVVLPVGALLAVLAEPVLVGVFGGQWRSAASSMQLFTIMGVLSPITLVCGSVWKATANAKRLLHLATLEMLTLLPAVALFAHHGIAAVAACQAGSTAVVVCGTLPGVVRLLDLRWRDVVGAILPAVTAAAVMCAVLLAVRSAALAPWPTMALGAVAGGLTYALVLWVVARNAIASLLAVVRPRLRRADGAAPVPEPPPASPIAPTVDVS
jgi:PST family polysaccharide transporter